MDDVFLPLACMYIEWKLYTNNTVGIVYFIVINVDTVSNVTVSRPLFTLL